MKRYTKQFLFLLLPALILTLVGFGIWRTSEDVRSEIQSNILSALENPEPFDLFELPGTTSGSGTYFEITDSDYINLTLESTEEITLTRLESIPEMITMIIEADLDTPTTDITLSNLPASTTLYKYEDNYHNLVTLTTDAAGTYTYTQDLTEQHFVFIQPRAGTKFIVDDATGGDCTSIGIWDFSTKTCTLTADVFESIQIDSDGITLDGNGRTVTGLDTGTGVFIGINKSSVTVKNLVITKFSKGIDVLFSNGNTIINNTTFNTQQGISLIRSNNNLVTSHTDFSSSIGIFALASSTNNTFSNNTLNSNASGGIRVIMNSDNNTIDNNTIQFSRLGIELTVASNNIITNNTVSNGSGFGIVINSSNSNRVINNTLTNNQFGGIGFSAFSANDQAYNNNFLRNSIPVVMAMGTSGNVFNLPAPVGGNYYEDFDEPGEGCNDINSDGFCDAPLSLGGGLVDNLPWTVQDGWSVGATQVTLTWDRNEDPDFESYRIFRNLDPGVDVGDELVETITNQAQTLFVDTTITSGQTYYYSVFVFDRAGLSAGGNEVSATP